LKKIDNMDQTQKITKEEFEKINSNQELLKVLKQKNIPLEKLSNAMFYESELQKLQIELVKLQRWVVKHKKRVVVIF